MLCSTHKKMMGSISFCILECTCLVTSKPASTYPVKTNNTRYEFKRNYFPIHINGKRMPLVECTPKIKLCFISMLVYVYIHTYLHISVCICICMYAGIPHLLQKFSKWTHNDSWMIVHSLQSFLQFCSQVKKQTSRIHVSVAMLCVMNQEWKKAWKETDCLPPAMSCLT